MIEFVAVVCNPWPQCAYVRGVWMELFGTFILRRAPLISIAAQAISGGVLYENIGHPKKIDVKPMGVGNWLSRD